MVDPEHFILGESIRPNIRVVTAMITAAEKSPRNSTVFPLGPNGTTGVVLLTREARQGDFHLCLHHQIGRPSAKRSTRRNVPHPSECGSPPAHPRVGYHSHMLPFASAHYAFLNHVIFFAPGMVGY